MENLNKEHLIAGAIGGAIGGAVSLTACMLISRFAPSLCSCCLPASQQKNEVKISTLVTNNLAKPIGAYSMGKKVQMNGGELAISSGCLGLDLEGNLVSDDVVAQTEQTLKNLQIVANDNGFQLSDALQCHVYLTDMKDFQAVNEVYEKFFGPNYPGRVCLAVAGLPKGGEVEIEATFFRSFTKAEEPKKEKQQEEEKQPEAKKSLYERLGGEPAIDAVVDGMYKGIFNDPELIDFFEKTDKAQQVERQKKFLKASFGGPVPYDGKTMKDSHKGRGITEKEFNLVAGHVVQSMKDLNVHGDLITEVVNLLLTMKNDVTG